MRVEEPRPIISRFDRDDYEMTVYVREDHWANYKWLRSSLGTVCAGLGIDVASPILQELANQLLSWASVTVGLLQIRLSLGALAIYAIMSKILVRGYRVISTPGWPYTWPIVWGEEYYDIETLD